MRKPAAPLPFTNGFYQSRSAPLSSQRCVNYYTNVSETGTLSNENLYGTLGIDLVDSGQALEPNRGSHEMAGVPYFVNGDSLYKLVRTVNPDLTETLSVVDIGTIDGEGRVSMADNGYQLCIVVPGGKAYIVTTGPDAIAEITDPDFAGPAETVVYLDGYFVFNKTDSNIIFHSELRDGTNYNALDFAEAEADPDNTVALHVHRNTLYVMGTQTMEPYSNVGGTEFAFAPIRGGVINKGLRSTFGIAEFNNSFAFIGSGENEQVSVLRFQGGSVTEISTVPIENLIQNATNENLDNAFAFYHSANKAHFFGVTVGDRTLVFDSTASISSGRKIWHERSSRVDDNDIQWRVSTIVQAYNKTFVGDLQDGRIGELKDDVYMEYGNPIIRFFTTQPFENSTLPMKVSRIEVTMTAGSGSLTYSPKVVLSWSDDGGRLFSDGLIREIGKTGEYRNRTIWRRLGRFAKTRVLKFQFSDPYDPSFLKLEVTAS